MKNETVERKAMYAEFVHGFFAPIAHELADPSVSEVMINGPTEIHTERGGKLERSASCFESEEQLVSALRSVAQYLGRSFDEHQPILEGRMPDGSRIQAMLPPLSAGGPCVAIRRHRLDSLTWDQLLEWGAITERGLEVIHQAVDQKKNIIVSGGTGSGKTSLLRCVASLIPGGQRVITIEDARELHLQRGHVVSLEARPADARGKGRVSVGDLFTSSLRMRPDRIVIGELRGEEAFDLIQAMTSGHGGCLSTIHASSPEDALRRLETLALFRGVELPLLALRTQVASAVDFVVQVERTSSGRRWVKSIAEVSHLDKSGDYRVQALMERVGDEFVEHGA